MKVIFMNWGYHKDENGKLYLVSNVLNENDGSYYLEDENGKLYRITKRDENGNISEIES